MTVIKAHPSAQSTYGSFAAPETQHVQPAYQSRQVASTYAAPVVEALTEPRDTHVPQSLTRPLAAQDTSLVDTRALLAFCEASLRKLNDSERRTVEKFKSKLEALEANLVARDHEIRALRQQVEDLQVLVKILERK